MTTKGKNLQDVQNMNRSLVIRTIQKKHHTTRAEISKETGLNKATVTNIVNDLISWGVVRETGIISGETGRRSIAIELAVDDYFIIGLWATRRHLHAGLYNLDGVCRQRQSYPIGLNSPVEDLIDTICEKVEKLRESVEDGKILGLALALPGPFLKDQGRIALLTGRSGWQDVDIVSILKSRIDLEIYFVHDTYAFTMAQWCFTENYNEKSSLFCITDSLGVGGCQIEKGQIVYGNLGTAGEIGHMSIDYHGKKCECGNRGCLERYCTTTAALKRAKEQLSSFPDTICREEMTESELMEAYLSGDELAHKVINEAGRYLGYGVANIINLFNPGKVIIGDEIARAGQEFLKVVKEAAGERVLPILFENTQVCLSEVDDSFLRGACMCLMQKAVEDSEDFFVNKSVQDVG